MTMQQKFPCVPIEGEPSFTLLARDPDFARLVCEWAARRLADIQCGERPETDRAKAMEAYTLSSEGAEWRKKNYGKWRKETL